jgi:hypothetical protein
MKLLVWFIPLGLLALLLCLLLRKRAYNACPCFFAYIAFAVAADVTRFVALDHADAYFATYWITEAGYDLLGILVMYEVLRTALGSLTRAWWARLIFPAVLVAGIGMSIARANVVPSRLSGIEFYIAVGEIAVRFVQVFVFAGLVTLVPVVGLRWRQYPFGVATGFGLYATVMLLTTIKFSDFGTTFKLLWGWTSLVAYSVAVLIWIWFFSVPQKVATSSSELAAPAPGVLKEYKDALRRMR